MIIFVWFYWPVKTALCSSLFSEPSLCLKLKLVTTVFKQGFNKQGSGMVYLTIKKKGDFRYYQLSVLFKV